VVPAPAAAAPAVPRSLPVLSTLTRDELLSLLFADYDKRLSRDPSYALMWSDVQAVDDLLMDYVMENYKYNNWQMTPIVARIAINDYRAYYVADLLHGVTPKHGHPGRLFVLPSVDRENLDAFEEHIQKLAMIPLISDQPLHADLRTINDNLMMFTPHLQPPLVSGERWTYNGFAPLHVGSNVRLDGSGAFTLLKVHNTTTGESLEYSSYREIRQAYQHQRFARWVVILFSAAAPRKPIALTIKMYRRRGSTYVVDQISREFIAD